MTGSTATHGNVQPDPQRQTHTTSGPPTARSDAVGRAGAVDATASRAGTPVDPVVEATYWRKNHASRPFAIATYTYEEFAPAYQYGWESFDTPAHHGKSFESFEGELAKGWDAAKGTSRLGWEHAKAAAQEAWDRVKNAAAALGGDSSGTSKGAATHV